MMTLQTQRRSSPGLPADLTFSIPIGGTAPSGSLGSPRIQLDAAPSVGERVSPAKVIETLERLLASDLDVAVRLRILRAWKAPLLAVCEEAGGNADRSGAALEGRLYRLMFRNLAAAVEQAADSQLTPDEDLGEWAIRNLFHFFQLQILHAARLEIPLPVGSWRDLHAVSVRLVVGARYPRTAHGSGDAGPALGRRGTTSIELRYKEVLLLGLMAQVSVGEIPDRASRLRGWAAETRLETPVGLSGQRGLWLVDVVDDAPPRECPGPLSTDFCGWVLFLPEDFVGLLDAARWADLSAPGNMSCPARL